MRLFLTLFRAMDKFSKDEIENWKKVKEALEKAGKTDCHFYTRAAAILSTGRDPMQW